MQYAKRFLMVAGTVALAVIVGSLAAPKATHALVAALVQVTNTSANPVPVTNVGPQQTFQGNCVNNELLGASSSCQIEIPAGKKLVVQSVSVRADIDAGLHVIAYSMATPFGAPGQSILFYPALPAAAPATNPGSGFTVFQGGQNLQFYAETGVQCALYYDGTLQLVDEINCGVSGYLIDAQ